MKSFYNEYKNDDEFVQLVAQIPWKHNIILMQKVKDKNIRKWYIEKVIEEDINLNLDIEKENEYRNAKKGSD